VGIRQILNHHPTCPALTWPKVTRDYLYDEKWVNNFKMLEKFNYSFDFQGNPHQLQRAAEVFSLHPNIPIIIDHLATLHIPKGATVEEVDKTISLWREGLQRMSSFPHVFLKISMLGFICPLAEGSYSPLVKQVVLEAISMFGSDRCMFGSNFPVDKVDMSAKKLYEEFQGFVKDLTEEDRQNLFWRTATKVYKF